MVNIQDLWNELKKCDQLGGGSNGWCKEQVRQRWIQELLGPRVYPWINLRWDYQQYVKNNYDPRKLGINKDGNMQALIKNIGILIQQLNSLLMDKNPNDNSRAGISDQPLSNNPFKNVYLELKKQIIDLKSNPTANAGKIAALKDTLDMMEKNRQISAKEYGLGINFDASYQKPPYNDPYFNKPITGTNSSSYFVQTGFCKTKDNYSECKAKGLNWIGDICYKGKYVYLDNSPGLKVGYVENMNGLIPSLINQTMQLNPISFAGILQGYSVPGIDIQQCLDEHFENKEHIASCNFIYVGLIVIVLMIIYILYK
jgi:hypothetical protein